MERPRNGAGRNKGRPSGRRPTGSPLVALLEAGKPLASSSSSTLAEVVRSYSQFRLPDLNHSERSTAAEPTLLDQAEGRSPLHLAQDPSQPPRGNPRLTNDQQAEVVRLFRAGLSLSAIARTCGMSWDSVSRLLASVGVRPLRADGGGLKLTPEDVAQAAQLRVQGWSLRQIAEKYGVSCEAVRQRLSRG
jgi:lambda repressor-like predicted transcriptional regulator